MEIELNVKSEITGPLNQLKKESNKKIFEIPDFVMIIDELLNHDFPEIKNNDKSTLDTLQKESKEETLSNEDIFSEFEFQLIENEKINSKDKSSNINKKIKPKDLAMNNESIFKIELTTSENDNPQSDDIKVITDGTKLPQTKNQFSSKEFNNNDLKTNNETLKLKDIKDDFLNLQDKKTADIKRKNVENILDNENTNQKTSQNSEKNIEIKTNLQFKNQEIILQKSPKEDSSQFINFKKEEKNQSKNENILLNTKSFQQEKNEKTQDINLKTKKTEPFPLNLDNTKKFEIKDENIGKIKMIFNSTTREMNIKITTNDKEIFKSINETKNQLANDISKDLDLEKTSIKVEINEENQNSKKQNQDLDKNNRKSNKQRKEKFSLV